MTYSYTTEKLHTTVLLDPTRPKLAAAAHLNGPWPHIVASIRSSLGAAREHLIESGYPKKLVKADDISLEVIDRTGDLDQVDRYLLRLILGQLCRDAGSKARQNPQIADLLVSVTPTPPPNGPSPNGPFAHSVRYGTKADPATASITINNSTPRRANAAGLFLRSDQERNQ